MDSASDITVFRDHGKIAVFSSIGQAHPHNEAVKSIEEGLRRCDWDMELHSNEYPRPHYVNRMALLIDKALSTADGVIWISALTAANPTLPDLLQRDAPRIVFANLRIDDGMATCVLRDDRSAVAALTRHLIDQGHRHIAYLGGPGQRLVSPARYRGFRDALHAASLPENHDWHMPFLSSFSHEVGRQAMEQLLRLPERPTACVCVTDPTAHGALQALADHELRVPEDMAVTGFDNRCTPGIPTTLTSIDLAFEEIGRQAVLRLLGQLDGTRAPGGQTFVPCPILLRASTEGAGATTREILPQLTAN